MNCLLRRQTSQFVPKPGYFPATGDDTIAGGIFCISLGDLGTYLAKTGNNAAGTGSESPKGSAAAGVGSGPYPAQAYTDSALAKHVVFAPKTPPPAGVVMPVLAWGNGGCATDPTTHQNLLIEIASHGYVIAADGVPGGKTGASQSMVSDMKASLDWITKGGAAKYGAVNTSAIATMGHSCGGLEAMSTAYHDDRVKRILMFNIAIFQDEKRYLLQEIKVPVAWFIGGPKDMGYPNVRRGSMMPPRFAMLTDELSRPRRTTSSFPLGCLRTRPASTPAMAARLALPTEESRVRRPWLTFNGNSAMTRHPRPSCWTPRRQGAWCRTSGLSSTRTGLEWSCRRGSREILLDVLTPLVLGLCSPRVFQVVRVPPPFQPRCMCADRESSKGFGGNGRGSFSKPQRDPNCLSPRQFL